MLSTLLTCLVLLACFACRKSFVRVSAFHGNSISRSVQLLAKGFAKTEADKIRLQKGDLVGYNSEDADATATESEPQKGQKGWVEDPYVQRSPYQDVIDEYAEELRSLHGTPDLVDRLENLVAKHPGIESDIALYRAIYPFPLDDFQEQGLVNLIAGSNVLVSTPTGSGKTLVGELAIYFALMMGLRVAYTTPLKALSNQKFQDFTKRYGGDRVGLLTGDIAINRGAKITVMTTEVFRNMIYNEDSQDALSNLFMVCFDEFHYMNDPDRGTVWEESVISCPSSVRILALSATMGNIGDIKGWIDSIHGNTELVRSNYRPVPLRYLFAQKQGTYPLFRDPNAGPGAMNGVKKVSGKLDEGSSLNPIILRTQEQLLNKARLKLTRAGRSPKHASVNPSQSVPKIEDVAEELRDLKLLPAIIFIFSRAGCEQNAKLIANSKAKLLSANEEQYVASAIGNFIRMNPDIPLQKSAVQMLRKGVGVHHAGLIPVWKAFIEDLFNANMIKVLFATETLAAGVNMPARSTVISSVTKRINSETIRLKTSQLLQMAGRAGRRGKDDQGTVVILKNRFEDSQMGHKILVSPVDGIRSHFKTSYGLVVKLLQSRSLEQCQELIERGFGAYLTQKKLQKRQERELGYDDNDKEKVDTYRTVLQKHTLQGARDYVKILRRLEKERRNGEYLNQKMLETDRDLVQAIVDYMPLGVGLQLLDGESGFFLGDVKYGEQNSQSGFGMITRAGKVLVVRKDHIRAFSETDDSIAMKHATSLINLMNHAESWDDVYVKGCKAPVLQAQYDTKILSDDVDIATAFESMAQMKPFPTTPLPGSVVKQQIIIDDLEKALAESTIEQEQEGDLVLQALTYAVQLKDPTGFVNAIKSSEDPVTGKRDSYAWKMFQNVVKILQVFNALDAQIGDGTNSTDLGETVASLSGDNELWLALVLQNPSVQALSPTELSGVVCSLVVDGYKATNAYFKKRPSEKVQMATMELEKIAWDLRAAQSELGIDFPVMLSGECAGLAESWATGISWRDMCSETSLDQGDVCRILRRTVEVLRQVPVAWGVTDEIANTAAKAADIMDRFPVSDYESPSANATAGVAAGRSVGNMNGTDTGDVALDDDFMMSSDMNDYNDEDSEEDGDRNELDTLLETLKSVEGTGRYSRTGSASSSAPGVGFSASAQLDALIDSRDTPNGRLEVEDVQKMSDEEFLTALLGDDAGDDEDEDDSDVGELAVEEDALQKFERLTALEANAMMESSSPSRSNRDARRRASFDNSIEKEIENNPQHKKNWEGFDFNIDSLYRDEDEIFKSASGESGIGANADGQVKVSLDGDSLDIDIDFEESIDNEDEDEEEEESDFADDAKDDTDLEDDQNA